jgi:hypothetical protein
MAAGPSSSLQLVTRTQTQDQGDWVIEYQLRYVGATGVILSPEEISVQIQAWVSNSRVPVHALPRFSSITFSGKSPALGGVATLVKGEPGDQCQEKLQISIWTGAERSPLSEPDPNQARSYFIVNQFNSPLSLAPGELVHVHLRLMHDHILFGPYDPLLGERTVTLGLGSLIFHDVVRLSEEQYLAQGPNSLKEPPAERRDTRHAVSGPDSLHLEAHVPGHQYYRFPDTPVRYNTPMRLRFWYLTAAKTEGEVKLRVGQAKDTPISYRMLRDAGLEKNLTTMGRWTKFEAKILTQPEATILSLEFTIVGDTEVGEVWIDDVSVEPVYSVPRQTTP